METSTWIGKFHSDTYGFIHGRLRTELRSLDQFGYTTKVKVKFDGFCALIAPIFSNYMEPVVTVCEGNKFETKIGRADIIFYIDTPLSKNVKEIKGHYVSQASFANYKSTGSFSLVKQ